MAKKKSYYRNSYSSGPPATDAQVALLMKLLDEGKVEEVYFKGLTVGEASDMISRALRKK